MEINKIYNGDSKKILQTLPDQSVDMCVTSPPYYGLRDYGEDGQIGLEETPEKYVDRLVDVFQEVNRVLKDDGTLWLNIGDSYWGGKGQSGSRGSEYQEKRNNNNESLNKSYQTLGGAKLTKPTDGRHEIIKPKDLIGIPWMLAFALRADGWYLRQDIIWHKPNPMPESVKDRCTKAHEYIFLLSKSKKYYYDHEAIKEDSTTNENRHHGVVRNREYDYDSKENNNPEAYLKPKSWNGSSFDKGKTGEMKHTRGGRASGNKSHKYVDEYEKSQNKEHRTKAGLMKIADTAYAKRNKRSVWTISTKSYSEAHFAVFPDDLIKPCILAGSRRGGVVLDPFFGSGTTGEVAIRAGRKFIGVELNPEYVELAYKRLESYLTQTQLF